MSDNDYFRKALTRSNTLLENCRACFGTGKNDRNEDCDCWDVYLNDPEAEGFQLSDGVTTTCYGKGTRQ